MYRTLSSMVERPPLYTKNTIPFWDDEHISKQMLKAHLDPDFEGASRKHSFIEQSVGWIKTLVPSSSHRRLLDIGCGPGIYAERFAKAGYEVTGIDFSTRSIAYAVASAREKQAPIRYFCQDYLNLDLRETFDLAVMIYCDYGALCTSDRNKLMRTVYERLRPGGKFLLDVFSAVAYDRFEEAQTWEHCENGGFWSQEPYIAIHGRYKYLESATLEHTIILADKAVRNYYLWNTYFTQEMLTQEAADAGFQVCGLFGDVAGSGLEKESLTMAILLEKPK